MTKTLPLTKNHSGEELTFRRMKMEDGEEKPIVEDCVAPHTLPKRVTKLKEKR